MAVDGKGLTWVSAGEENGHAWERAYHDNRLVAIRCANCGEVPMNVMRQDFTAETCRVSAVAKTPGITYADLLERVNQKVDKGGVTRFSNYGAALRHMADTPDSFVIVVAVSRDSAGFMFDKIMVAATDMWGGAVRADRPRQRLDWSRSTLRVITPENAGVLDGITPTGVVS